MITAYVRALRSVVHLENVQPELKPIKDRADESN
jgi:hypothetical protein